MEIFGTNIDFWNSETFWYGLYRSRIQFPHANGVRASVLHVRSCVGNRLFASTQLAVMPYPSHKNAVQNPTIANIESILLSVSLHAGGSRSIIEWRPVLVGIYPVSNAHKASAGCTTRWLAAYYSSSEGSLSRLAERVY